MKNKGQKIAFIVISASILFILIVFFIIRYLKQLLELIISICGGFIGLCIFVLLAIFTLPDNGSNELPQNLSGAVPFEIVYSVDGEVFKHKDIFICECRVQDAQTKEYSHLKESYKYNNDNTIYVIDGKSVRIDCGNAEYYLLSEKPYEDYVPGQYIYYDGEEFTLEEAKLQLGIEIISTRFFKPDTLKSIMSGIIIFIISSLTFGAIITARYLRRKRRLNEKNTFKKAKIIILSIFAVIVSIPLNLLRFLCIIVILSPSVFILAPVLNFLLESVLMMTLVAPKVPEIQYAEFPFEVVYSIDGEIYEINDSYVCEYKGVTLKYGEKELDWATYLKYSDTKHIELYDKGNNSFICLYAGSPEYYMMESFPPYGDHVPGEYLHYSSNHKREELTAEEAKEEYGLEIISAKFSEPIDNEFEYTTVDKIKLFIYNLCGTQME